MEADLRWLGMGFDGRVPVELKLADNRSGLELFERLEVQLCGDYLRDTRSGRGIFLLVRRGAQASWKLPASGKLVDFEALVQALQDHWETISPRFPGVEEIRVIGIDLKRRFKSPLDEATH